MKEIKEMTGTSKDGDYVTFDGKHYLVTDSDYVTFEGKRYLLTQQAFSDNGKTYQARCLSDDGENYYVYWDVINFDCDDESNSCNWDKPSSVEKW